MLLPPSKQDIQRYAYAILSDAIEDSLELFSIKRTALMQTSQKYHNAVASLMDEFDDLITGLDGSSNDRELLCERIEYFGAIQVQAQKVCEHLSEKLSSPHIQHDLGLYKQVTHLLNEASWVATKADRKRSLLHGIYITLDKLEDARQQFKSADEKHQLAIRRKMYLEWSMGFDQLDCPVCMKSASEESEQAKAERRFMEAELGFQIWEEL